MQGKVEKVWHNQREDGSEYWVLSIDGKRYATWDKELVATIRQGSLVEFAFTQSGRYRNLTALKALSSPAFTTADSLGVSAESLRIVRMNCLRTAAELVKDSLLLPEQKASQVVSVAETLERHVLGHSCDCPQQGTENAEDKQAEGEGGANGQ